FPRLPRHDFLSLDDALPVLALGTMFVDLCAPLALLRGKVRTFMVGAMWFFHVAILGVMAIVFIYPLTFVAYASLLRPERLADARSEEHTSELQSRFDLVCRL